MSEANYNDAKLMDSLRKQQAEALAKAQATGHADDIRRLSMINQKMHFENNRKSRSLALPVEFAVIGKR